MRYRSDIVVLLLTAALCCICTASAQSGRRATKPASPPVPIVEPPADSTPQLKPAPTPDLSKQLVTVAGRSESGIVSRENARVIRESFMRQLESDTRFRFVDGHAMTRDGAKDMARAGNNGYVVWLELSPDTYDYDSPYRGSINYYDVIIKYSVFRPGTTDGAKEGRVYYQDPQQRRRTSTLGIPGSTRGPVSSPRVPAEYTPDRAGRETARRVLNHLNDMVLKAPPAG
jgi:hypothetical protein